MRKNVIAIIIVIIMAVILSLAVILLFKADNIEVSGNEICDENMIKEFYTDGPLGDNTLVIWLKNRLGIYGDMPFIREHDIDIIDRSTVKIQVYEKSLIACFYYMGQYIYFDKDGMILETSDRQSENIPCIEGVSFSNFTINEKIEVENEGQIEAILDLSELINHYDVYVDKISFSSNNEVTLYCGDIKVFLGNKQLYDQQIASVSDVLKQAEKQGLSGTIDLKNYSRGDKIILKQ